MAAEKTYISLSEAILRSDLAESRLTEAHSREMMHHLWQVMQATSRDYDPAQRSRSGLSGGDAAKVEQAHQEGKSLGGDYLAAVTAEALKTAECMLYLRSWDMKSNYDILGNHIRLIDTRNRESITDRVLGINIDKFFMPSVANVIGTDLSKYKLITKGKFACNPMHVGRDERLPVALYDEEEPAIVSPAYFMFEVVDNSILNEDYLIMWFRRPEFDRICWLHTDGSVRGGITWDDICRLELPIPPIENQLEIVNSYKAITERIALKQKINDNLAA